MTLKTREEVIPYGRKLQEKGARNVLISMAGEGAVLIAENGEVYSSPAPKGTLVNGVGAGDSMVAGFMAGWMEKQDYEHAFHMGVATGSAGAFFEYPKHWTDGKYLRLWWQRHKRGGNVCKKIYLSTEENHTESDLLDAKYSFGCINHRAEQKHR